MGIKPCEIPNRFLLHERFEFQTQKITKNQFMKKKSELSKNKILHDSIYEF